ncbi:MAG TPA: DUF1015 domain-containing protein, partial [Deltaproteobacteria bacterium]|nr:DUF1015 domain-containing protein [Deltaproteobacteria bacterium]
MNFEKIALSVPRILLPKAGIDLRKWAVVACDQYTSQPLVWEKIEELVGDEPSTLHMIFPEVYLEESDSQARIVAINSTMERYLQEGLLTEQRPGFVLLDRRTAHAASRKGLVVALDLEHYDFSATSKTLIRATEGTVIDRLPPRIKIREHAALESPHIMVLIDDPERTVIEPLFHKSLPMLYDFDLMMDSGHLTGYLVEDEGLLNAVAASLERLADPAYFQKRYGVQDERVLLYAMGDGNHSLATAKVIWERLKEQASDKASIMRHPARYALVELVNIHDPGLEFEPIHRVLFQCAFDELFDALQAFCKPQGSQCSVSSLDSLAALRAYPKTQAGAHVFPFVNEGRFGVLTVEHPKQYLEYATIQTFLDEYLMRHGETRIDYVHGEAIVTELGSKPGNIGFYMPTISKNTFFKTIVLDGALPRK